MEKAFNENDDFIFISFSHEDEAVVRKDAERLRKDGINLYIDLSEMKAGENWKDAVQEKIRSKKCCAVVFYVSSNSLLSENCLEELLLAEMEECQIILIDLNKNGLPDTNIARSVELITQECIDKIPSETPEGCKERLKKLKIREAFAGLCGKENIQNKNRLQYGGKEYFNKLKTAINSYLDDSRVVPKTNFKYDERERVHPDGDGKRNKATIVAHDYPDGGRYYGEAAIQDGEALPHGFGLFTDSKGYTYVGSWKKGVQNGIALLVYPDGKNIHTKLFIGNFKDNKKNGLGFSQYKSKPETDQSDFQPAFWHDGSRDKQK